MNLDEMLAEQKRKEVAIAAAIEEFNAEQAAGRLGLEPYQRAKLIAEQQEAFAGVILLKVNEVLASL